MVCRLADGIGLCQKKKKNNNFKYGGAALGIQAPPYDI